MPPSEDYVALGVVCTNAPAPPPPLEAVRVVPREWVVDTGGGGVGGGGSGAGAGIGGSSVEGSSVGGSSGTGTVAAALKVWDDSGTGVWNRHVVAIVDILLVGVGVCACV